MVMSSFWRDGGDKWGVEGRFLGVWWLIARGGGRLRWGCKDLLMEKVFTSSLCCDTAATETHMGSLHLRCWKWLKILPWFHPNNTLSVRETPPPFSPRMRQGRVHANPFWLSEMLDGCNVRRNFHLGAPDARQHEMPFSPRDILHFCELPFMLCLALQVLG